MFCLGLTKVSTLKAHGKVHKQNVLCFAQNSTPEYRTKTFPHPWLFCHLAFCYYSLITKFNVLDLLTNQRLH